MLKNKEKKPVAKPPVADRWQVKAEEYLAGWQRALADLDNFKKDLAKREEESATYAAKEIILELIPVMDNFDRAFEALGPKERYSEWIKGFEFIRDQLNKLLLAHGVERIKTLGVKFNPRRHEAVKQSVGHPGLVVGEVLGGYTLHGKVIRAAKVKVGVPGKAPKAAKASEAPEAAEGQKGPKGAEAAKAAKAAEAIKKPQRPEAA